MGSIFQSRNEPEATAETEQAEEIANVVIAKPSPRIASGYSHTCMLNDSNEVQCWGSNRNQQLDTVEGFDQIVQLSSARKHTCVLDNGGVKCWGWNAFQQNNAFPER